MDSYRLRVTLYSIVKTIVSLLLAFVIGGVLLYAAGFNPFQVYRLMLAGAFAGGNSILTSLYYATPLIFTGLAFAFAQHAGCINLGAEGQLYMGAITAALIGGYLPSVPKVIHIPLILVCSALVASMFGALIAYLKVKFHASEVIVAFMLNSIIISFCSYLVNGPFLDEQKIPRTQKIAQTAQLGKLFAGHYLSYATVIAVVVVIIAWFALKYTRFGYRMHLLRAGSPVAETAGVPIRKMVIAAFAISAAIAGLCGAGQVMGVTYRFTDGFSPGYGFDGIAVYALAGGNPLSILLAAFFWGGLSSGAAMVNRVAVIPMDVISLIQAIVVILMAAPKCMDALCAPIKRVLLKEDNQHD